MCWISRRGARGDDEREIPSIHTYIHIDYINLTIFVKVATETNRNSWVSLKSSGSNAAAPVPQGGGNTVLSTRSFFYQLPFIEIMENLCHDFYGFLSQTLSRYKLRLLHAFLALAQPFPISSNRLMLTLETVFFSVHFRFFIYVPPHASYFFSLNLIRICHVVSLETWDVWMDSQRKY